MIGEKMLKEFKDFIAKGNVMDMAVGIIIGAAFTAIVTSLVGDLINPIISLALGGADFSSLYATLDGSTHASLAAAEEAGSAVFAYGRFIMAVINFIVIAFVVFMLVRSVNKMKAKEEAAVSGPSDNDLLADILKALKKK